MKGIPDHRQWDLRSKRTVGHYNENLELVKSYRRVGKADKLPRCDPACSHPTKVARLWENQCYKYIPA
jgi:hypothetical protein